MKRRSTSPLTLLVRGIRVLIRTAGALGVSMAVILGTAWFMIPGPEWKPTADFARERGREALDSSTSKIKAMLHPGAR